MIKNQYPKSIFLLVAGCLLVVSIVGGTMFGITKEANREQQLSDFNQALLSFNRETHHSGMSKTSHQNSDQSPFDADNDPNRSPVVPPSETIVTTPKTRSSNLQPYSGKLDATREEPAFDWLDPQVSINTIVEAARERGGDEDVYGWIQLRSDVKASKLQSLTQNLGVEVVSSSPKYVRVKLPDEHDELVRLADLPEIEGFGLMPLESKRQSHLMEAFDSQSYDTEAPVFITTMGDDSDGSMRQRLIAMGATVGQWDPEIRTYSANVDRMTLGRVLAADFVEKVSPNALVRVNLADLTGVMGADLHRTFTEADRVWSGDVGAGVTIGVMDTGINANHREFSDKSICTRATDYSSGGEIDARLDPHGHGSHVSGIATARGSLDSAYAGVAPGVKSLRVAKVVDNFGSGDTLMYFNGVDFHTETDPCDDPATADPAHVINVSLGGFTPELDGTSIISRKMDAASYHFKQNYVISASNEGAFGPSDAATTKSAMSVGMTTDSGVIHTISSHGPTADGRMLPHIVAPGFAVTSVRGEGHEEGYFAATGTSMSAPAVSGLASVLIGANPELAENPAAVRATLMAAAIKPRRWIGAKENMPENNSHGPGDIQAEYGLGFASLVPHDLDGVEHGLLKGEMNSDEMASTTITVPEGIARLDIVLAFNEPASPALDRTVLSNLDLYLDKDANCTTAKCGEHSSKSTIDTVEWLLIKDPTPGTYKLKVVPANAFDSPVLFGAAWVMIDDDLPKLSITSETNSAVLGKDDRFEIDLSIGASGFVANAVTVHVMCRAIPIPAEEQGEKDKNPCDAYRGSSVRWLPGSSSSRGDGTMTDMATNSFSQPIPVGAVTATRSKNLTLRLHRSSIGKIGTHTLYFVATSWNGMSDYHAVNVVVDGDADLPPRAMPPANDDIDNAMALTGNAGVLQPDLILATREGGEPMLRDSFGVVITKFPISSDGNLSFSTNDEYEYVRNNSVWYMLDAPIKPTLFGLGNIPGNVGVNVYKDFPAKSAMIADNWNVPDSNGADNSLAVNLEPQSKYYVQVYTHEDVGDLEMPWITGDPKPPANDHFANAKAISGDIGRVSGTNFKASLEVFETYDSRFAFSTWYSWTPTTDGAFMFHVDGAAKVVVLSGSNPNDIRRISTVPDYDRDHIYAYAVAGQSYRVVLLSDATQDTLGGYWLEWGKVDDVKNHAPNDMFAMAPEAVNRIQDDWRFSRTVEPGEPKESGVGSRWWKWTAPSSGNFTFESNGLVGDMASVFSGSSLPELQLLGSGNVFVASVEEGTEYYVSVGRAYDEMYVDFLLPYGVRGSRVTWGPTPANDSRANAITLEGGTGTAAFTHAFATIEASDGLPHQLTHSLWWEWTAPDSGWIQFATDSNPAQPAYLRQVDSIVAVYDPETGRRIGTSDRSYVVSGVAEITFYAESGTTYTIQSVLRRTRSRRPFEETTLSWGPVDPPPYSRFVGRYRDADPDPDLEVEEIENPTSIASNEGGGKVFVNAAGGLVVFDAIDVDTMPEMSNEVPYVDATDTPIEGVDDAFLYWDNTMNALYAIASDTIWLANGYDEDDGHFESCAATGTNYGEITDAFTTSDGKFLYILGVIPLPEGVVPNPFIGPFPEYEISIFSRNDASACELSHVQTVDSDSISALKSTNSFVASADSNYVYLASNDGVTTLARNATTGELTVVDSDSVFERKSFRNLWRNSKAALAPLTNDHLFIVGTQSPLVAVYSLADPADPQIVDSVGGYYLTNRTFPTLELPRPTPGNNCKIVGSHAASIAIDFMCRRELFTAELQESGYLRLMDVMYGYRQDRFGRTLADVPFSPAGLKTAGVRPLSQNLFILNLGIVDSLAVFDHLKQIEGNPND